MRPPLSLKGATHPAERFASFVFHFARSLTDQDYFCVGGSAAGDESHVHPKKLKQSHFFSLLLQNILLPH